MPAQRPVRTLRSYSRRPLANSTLVQEPAQDTTRNTQEAIASASANLAVGVQIYDARSLPNRFRTLSRLMFNIFATCSTLRYSSSIFFSLATQRSFSA